MGQNENFTFWHLNDDDGLSHPTIYKIFQDSRGFMWFGTYNGLNKYDGYDFTEFTSTETNKSGLSNYRIRTIFEDSKNNLWFGTFNGLNKFIPENNSFKKYFPENNSNSIAGRHVCSIIEENHSLWIGTHNGISCFNLKQETFTNYKHNPEDENSISSDIVEVIFKDNKDRLWIGTMEKGLNLFNKKTKTFKHFIFGNGNPTLNSIRRIIQINDKEFLIGTNNGLIKFQPDVEGHNHKIYHHDKDNQSTISKGRVRDLLKDKHGTIWVATQFGLDIYLPESETFMHLKSDPTNKFSLSVDEICDIEEDDQGNIWFGAYKGGLNILNPQQKYFKNWTKNLQNVAPDMNNSVLSIVENEDNTLYISVDHGGLNLFDRKQGCLKSYHQHSKNNRSSISDAITKLVVDKKGDIWTGTWAGGLSCFKTKSKKFIEYSPPYIESLAWFVWDVKEDSKENIWVASYLNGIICYNKTKNEYINYTKETDNKHSLSSKNTWCVFEDSKYNIWVGAENGLNKFVNKGFKYYNYKTAQGITLNSYCILTLFEDSKNRLWIGTTENGLSRFDEKQAEFIPFDESDGLINNSVNSIIEDDNGYLWLGTNKGLSKVFIDENDSITEVYNFNKDNGLQTTHFNRSATCKSVTGELFFGGSNGLVFFNPDSIKPNNYMPKVYITELKILNKIVTIDTATNSDTPLSKDITLTEEISLHHEQIVFTLKFAALSYIARKKNKYAYMLEGFDKNWNYIENKREATYTNLDAGKYIFKVKAANNDGEWNVDHTRLIINILPPWWDTWWFKSLLIIAIIIILLTIYYLRVKRLKKQKAILESTVEIRTRELQDNNAKLEESQDELYQLNEQLYIQKEGLEKTLTELNETQAQLIQSEKTASFAILNAGIAHEINNPLNFIQGGKTVIENCLLHLPKEKKQEILSALNIIQVGISRTSSVVDSLCRVNIFNSTTNKKCNIHSILDYCINYVLGSIDNKKISIEKLYSKDGYCLKGIEGELERVFLNVLSNSIEAIQYQGQIIVKTEVKDNNLKIAITDTGKGITSENLKKITDPFFTTKKTGKGSGLGMSMALSIIQQHRGSIDYKSEPGVGTDVIICLPLEDK